MHEDSHTSRTEPPTPLVTTSTTKNAANPHNYAGSSPHHAEKFRGSALAALGGAEAPERGAPGGAHARRWVAKRARHRPRLAPGAEQTDEFHGVGADAGLAVGRQLEQVRDRDRADLQQRRIRDRARDPVREAAGDQQARSPRRIEGDQGYARPPCARRGCGPQGRAATPASPAQTPCRRAQTPPWRAASGGAGAAARTRRPPRRGFEDAVIRSRAGPRSDRE